MTLIRTLAIIQRMNTLEKVAAKLAPLKGEKLFDIADKTGVSYDTLIRIRDGAKYDPSFSIVQKLAEHFGIVKS